MSLHIVNDRPHIGILPVAAELSVLCAELIHRSAVRFRRDRLPGGGQNDQTTVWRN